MFEDGQRSLHQTRWVGGIMAGYCPACGMARSHEALHCAGCAEAFDPVPTRNRSYTAGKTRRTTRRDVLGYGALGLGIAAVVGARLGVFEGDGIVSVIGGDHFSTDTSLIPVAFGGKCGYVDNLGKIVINPQFDNALAFMKRFDLAPVFAAKKVGLIDRSGKYVVNPQFDSIQVGPDESTIRVLLGKRWGTIDEEGKFLINPQFDSLSEFDSKGRAVATINGKSGIVGLDGQFIIPPTFDGIEVYYSAQLRQSAGTAMDYFARPLQVKRDEKYGFIDGSGNFLIPLQFINEEDFDDSGLAAAAMQVVDDAAVEKQRREQAEAAVEQQRLARAEANIPAPDATHGIMYEGMLPVESAPTDATGPQPMKTLWGYIDKNGKFVISPQFDTARHFNASGIAPVSISSKQGQLSSLWGYVDTQGKFSINPQFGDARPFVQSNGEWLAVVSNTPAAEQDTQWV